MTFPSRSVMRPFRRLALQAGRAAAALCLGITPVFALQDPSALCERAASEASRREGVPLSVLTAISLNETGRKSGGRFRAWPWTVNMEGKGVWLDTHDQALGYAEKEFARGARSFDVGCFQINYKWHGQHFSSIEEMFDPLANALYAARFLRTLRAEQGSWEKAAGAYHSRNPEFAERYAARFARFRNALADEGQEDIPEIPDIVLAAYGEDAVAEVPQVNAYPLLQSGGVAGLGSLVPIDNGSGLSLFGGPEGATR
jgi:Transglycosylase SLT domain